MIFHRAVMIHGLADARAALAARRPVTLLSASGAGLYAGCLWWRGIVDLVRRETSVPDNAIMDILDCADGSGQAMAALRAGVRHLVLWREAPGWNAAAEIAAKQGGCLMATAPASLDMAHKDAHRRLDAWLAAAKGCAIRP
jgi:hypothetical protein